jgi:hypothetical protein
MEEGKKEEREEEGEVDRGTKWGRKKNMKQN